MSNHQAIIARVTETIPIPGADNIHIAKVLGENVIVSKDVEVGYVGVLFPAEVQLSEEYCRVNNLFRHAHLNADPNKTGFFDDNRRVRAQPFLKVKSEAYFAGLESLDYIIKDAIENAELEIGVSFDTWYGRPICCKYISQATRDAIAKAGKTKQVKKKAETPYFLKHVDTAQFKHSAHMIPKGALLTFQSKRHGTSGRSGITKVVVEHQGWKKFVNKLLPDFFPTETWKHIVGSRNVVLSDPDKVSFHGSEGFRFQVAAEIEPYLEKGMTAFYEIVGHVNGKPIMPQHSIKALKDKSFTKKYGDVITYNYGCKEHEYRFHIYRLTYLTESGKNVDFSQQQLEAWCKDRNLPYTLEVSLPEIYDGDIEKLAAKVEYLTERPDLLTEDFTDPSHISEGIIIRVDDGSLQPWFLKSKSFAFRALEGLCEVCDPEDVEALVV